MQFIKQIFLENTQPWVHKKFVRYGKGEFDGPTLSVKKSKDSVKINASVGYASSLVRIISQTPSDVTVKGSIFAKRDVTDVIGQYIEISKSSGKKGLYSVDVSGTIASGKLDELCDKIPDADFLVDVSAGRQKLKCKKKLPKPGSKIDDGFCSAELSMDSMDFIFDELLFDLEKTDFNEIGITHRYTITELVAPDDIRKDPARFRVEAKRQGVIRRTVTIDKDKKETEHVFLV